MRKTIICSTIFLSFATSTAVSAFEHRDGTYFCSVKFAGGIAYDEATKQWAGAKFRPSGNFFVRLRYVKTRTENAGQPWSYDLDDYLVFITKEGEEFRFLMGGCYGDNLKRPGLDQYGFLSCSSGGQDYKFNFKNNRFIQIYTVGYVNGLDNNNDTPSISGGVCTKVSGGQDDKLLDLLQRREAE